jgi:hypothetical protein
MGVAGKMEASLKDYYAILGVPKDATFEEIKRAFRDKAKKYHPDVCKLPDAHERFIEIGEAYEILGNPETRKEYDRLFKHEGRKSYDTFADFGQARQNAKARAESYAKMTLEDLLLSVLGKAFEMGKNFLVGEDDKPRLTFSDYLSLGFRGFLLIICIVISLTGVGTVPGIVFSWIIIKGIQKDGKYIGIGPMIEATIITILVVVGILLLFLLSLAVAFS